MINELCDRESSIEVIFHGNNNENDDSSKEKLLVSVYLYFINEFSIYNVSKIR